MQTKLFAVKDLIATQFDSPFASLNEPTARRQIRDVVSSQPNSRWSKYPNDFELWEIGDYDDETGTTVAQIPRRCGSVAQIVPELNQGMQNAFPGTR